MKSRINEILEKIDSLKEDLLKEYQDLMNKYLYEIEKGKIKFPKRVREYNKKFKAGLIKYIFTPKIRHLLSIPFIYGMIIPLLILDIFLTIYQWGAFTLCGIPKVNKKDYIKYDRRFLDYLNIIQKFHCIYCTYANGIFSYAVEVAGRTERYWCPIKHATRLEGEHDWQKTFADYGDPQGFKEVYNDNIELKQKIKEKSTKKNLV